VTFLRLTQFRHGRQFPTTKSFSCPRIPLLPPQICTLLTTCLPPSDLQSPASCLRDLYAQHIIAYLSRLDQIVLPCPRTSYTATPLLHANARASSHTAASTCSDKGTVDLILHSRSKSPSSQKAKAILHTLQAAAQSRYQCPYCPVPCPSLSAFPKTPQRLRATSPVHPADRHSYT